MDASKIFPDLCGYCSAVFPKLNHRVLSPNKYPGPPEPIARCYPAQVESYVKNPICGLCSIALSIVEAELDAPFACRTEGYSLWAVDMPKNGSYDQTKPSTNELVTGIYLKLRANAMDTGRSSETHMSCRRGGLIMPALDPQTAKKSHSVSAANIINHNQVDYKLVKSWIRECFQNHSGCSSGYHGPAVGMKVIDCERRKLAKHEPGQRYLALSYVWGPSKPEGLIATPENIFNKSPRVIRDAIHVTRELGYRYLWVDRYCINQAGGKEKTDQLEQMDLIYENADLTIVAGSGQDDRHGLPGAGTKSTKEPLLPRSRQPVANIGNTTLLSTLPEISHYLEKSKWTTRGWCYQEAVLSRRCLIFFPSQVFFVCRTMCRSETLPDTPNSRVSGGTEVNLQNMFVDLEQWNEPGTVGRPFFTQVGDLHRHIEMYSARSLTKDSDTHNAFLGILKRSNCKSYWGIPILGSQSIGSAKALQRAVSPFEAGDPRRPLKYSNTPRADSAVGFSVRGPQENITAGFLRGLLWSVLDPEPTERREEMPSWTWHSVKGGTMEFRWAKSDHIPMTASIDAVGHNGSQTKVWITDGEDGRPWTPLPDWVYTKTGANMIPRLGNSLLIEGFLAPVNSMFQKGAAIYIRTVRNILIGLLPDLDSLLPEPFFDKRNKWRSMATETEEERDIRKLGWVILSLVSTKDARGWKSECIVCRKIGDDVYERVGFVSVDGLIPDTKKVTLILK